VKVAVVKTTPETIFFDVERVMDLADYKKTLPPADDLVLKLNLSWTKFYPACSTSVWVLDGALRALFGCGHSKDRMLVVENRTVVTDPKEGSRLNKWDSVLGKYGLSFTSLADVEWVSVRPKRDLIIFQDMFEEVRIPRLLIGKNILHLPTVKTHGHSVMTGSIKNAFGAFMTEVRHKAHSKIHEVLVDLLIIQDEFCEGTFSVTDGTVLGDGAGPRTMIWKDGNILMASSDMVASDAIQTWIMFHMDPFELAFLKKAHDLGLGVADPDQIEIVGDFTSVGALPFFDMKAKRSPVISWDRTLRGSFLRDLLFETSLFQLCIWASEIYHDVFWYNLLGKSRVKEFLKSRWGQLYERF